MRYEPVIGMEVHVELSTNSKCFCGCSIEFGGAPNTQVCPVCLGLPGVLPVLNETALEYTLRTAIALNCRINRSSQFERKNYYYPDLPKNYQISQLRKNLGEEGWLDIVVNGETKRIGMDNVHLEEDAGKLVHPEFSGVDYSLVDLNRAGTPLIEIVSKPDMHSTDDALAYMETLKNLLQYLEISDCNMHEGRLRFEANISVRPEGTEELRTKVEIKNLNSMRTVLRCIEHEVKRQSQAYDRGERIAQETRLWDEAAVVTRTMRSKEQAHDYRYFPDPDLTPFEISEEQIEAVRRNLPELRDAKMARFIGEYGLPEYDAALITASKPLADYYEQAVRTHNNPKAISNWIMTELLRRLKDAEAEVTDIPMQPEHLGRLVALLDDNTLSGPMAKKVFAEMMESGTPPEQIVEEQGLKQVTDTSAIEALVDQAIAANPKAADDVRQGNRKAVGALVGYVMKASKGQANPAVVNELLDMKLRV